MAELVGHSAWGEGSSWPSGVASGDLGVFVRIDGGSSSRTPGVLSGWSRKGRFVYRSRSALAMGFTWHTEVYTRVLSAADISGDPPGTYGQVIVLRGTTGVGASRTGTLAVPTQPDGGALLVAYADDSSGDGLPSGASWWLPPGEYRQRGAFGPVSSWSAAAWIASPSGGVVGPGGGRVNGSLALELLPPASPSSPTVLSPSEGAEVDATSPVEVAWQHRPSVAGGSQRAYQLRVGDEYWSASTGQLSPSPVTNTTSSATTELPAAEFTSGVRYELELRTQEDVDGRWSPWSGGTGFTPVTPPSVSTPTVTSLPDDLRPTIEWSSSTPRGVQTAWRVQVATDLGVIVHDSNAQPGQIFSYRVPVLDWSNGGSYQARVRVQQTGGSWSPWSTESFMVSWTPPADPVITATPERQGVMVSVTTAAVAAAREALEDLLGEVPVYGPDVPADESRVWVTGGEASRYADYGPGPVTNLVTNPRGRNTSGTVVVAENFCPNPSFEYGLDTWNTQEGLTLTQSTDGALGVEGDYVASLAPNGSGYSAGAAILNTPAAGAMPVAEGDVVSIGGRVRRAASSAPATMRLLMLGYASDGSYFGTLASNNSVSTLAGSPASFSQGKVEGVTIPAGVSEVRLGWYLQPSDPTWTSGALLFDAHQMVKAATLPDYADGDSTSADTDLTWTWAGTAGASTSQLTAPGVAKWVAPPDFIYYSARHDSFAMAPTPGRSSARAYTTSPTGETTAGEAYTWTVDMLSEGEPTEGYLSIGGAASGPAYVGTQPIPLTDEWQTVHLGIESVGGNFVWRVQSDGPGTIYFRVALIDGTDTYEGPCGDGYMFGWSWNGTPGASTSTYPGPGWYLIDDPAIQTAAQDVADAETGAEQTTITVERITPQGTWVPVARAPAIGGGLDLIDTFALHGASTAWRALAAKDVSGQYMRSGWGVSDPVVSTDRHTYLASAYDPLRTWIPVIVGEDSEHGRTRPVSVQYGLGDTRARVMYGPGQGRTGTLMLRSLDREQTEDMVALLESGEPLLLRWPPDGYPGTDQTEHLPNLTFAVSGELSVARRAQTAVIRGRDIGVPWVEQDDPGLRDTTAPITHQIGA